MNNPLPRSIKEAAEKEADECWDREDESWDATKEGFEAGAQLVLERLVIATAALQEIAKDKSNFHERDIHTDIAADALEEIYQFLKGDKA